MRGGKYIYIILESCVSRSASRETDADTSAWGQSGDVRNHYRRFRFTCVVLRAKQAARAGRGGVKGE